MDLIYAILNIPSQNRTDCQIEKLKTLTQHVNFFQQITIEQESTDVHSMCCRAMVLEKYLQNETILKFGDKGEKFFILLEGTASVQVPSKKRITIDKKSIINIKNHIISHDPISEQLDNKILIKITDVLNTATVLNNTEKEEKSPMQCILNTEEKKLLKIFKKTVIKEQKVLMSMFKHTDMNTIEIEIDDFTEETLLKPGDSFGELSLISDRLLAATYKALQNSSFLVLKKSDFTRILGTLSEKRVTLITKFLRNLPYFYDFSKIALIRFAYLLQHKSFTRNQYLFQEGEVPDGIYFVKSGEFTICRKHIIKRPDVPQEFDSSLIFISTRYLKRKKKSVNVKIIIKGKHESIGSLEVLNGGDYREYSSYCTSTHAEVYYISKAIFWSRVPNLDEIKEIMSDENTRLSDRFAELTGKIKFDALPSEPRSITPTFDHSGESLPKIQSKNLITSISTLSLLSTSKPRSLSPISKNPEKSIESSEKSPSAITKSMKLLLSKKKISLKPMRFFPFRPHLKPN